MYANQQKGLKKADQKKLEELMKRKEGVLIEPDQRDIQLAAPPPPKLAPPAPQPTHQVEEKLPYYQQKGPYTQEKPTPTVLEGAP